MAGRVHEFGVTGFRLIAEFSSLKPFDEFEAAFQLSPFKAGKKQGPVL